MKHVLDARFLRESECHRLRYTCEACAMFDPGRQRCAHDYPTESHRAAYYLQSPTHLVFCKEFELA